MADIDALFPSKWLKASDLGTRRVTVRMSHVKVEEVGQKKEKRPVLYFKGTDKGLVLNVTNATMIKEVTGSHETDDWHGRQILLYVTKVEYGGKRVDGIRVDYPEAPKSAALGQPRPAPPVVAAPMTPVSAVADEFLPVEDTFATGPDLSDEDIAF
jgi:hypothetical protein